MRASRVENTHGHSTRDTPSPLPLKNPLEPHKLDSSLLPVAMAAYHNQSYTPIPFVRSEGFLTKMFGRRDAAFFIESLLKVDVRDVYLVGNVPGWHNALMAQTPSIHDARVDAFDPTNRPLWLLDIVPPPMYHVVPQKIWTPPNQSDWRRYVEQASLRMPVFFIQNDGVIGLPLTRALAGDRQSLRCAEMSAPLGGGHSTQIRIAWPGYESWERQIQIRDQTRQRNEITLERFVKLVAGVVDRFLTVASSIATADSPWRVAHGGINRNNVVIVGAVQVSAGGWMPILQVYNPIANPTTTQYYPAHA
ncbi:hypothetical protein F5888DRAFT_1690213 [Russula emetica]|nr:hypothetical protein F5888DRAFT_1690213 [Russula emetica]